MISTVKIQEIQRKIADLILDECTNGQQSLDLPEGVLACGQFVGTEARHLGQRGLHGTAAAIRVLGAADDETARSVVPKLVNYLDRREYVESRRTGQVDQNLYYKIRRDQANVIKISEMLYALQCVNPSAFDTGFLSHKLAQYLFDARVQNGRGWTFFSGGEDNEAELIPTAHAVIALSKFGASHQIRNAIDFLANAIDSSLSNVEQTSISQDYSAYIIALFAITFHDENIDYKHKQLCQRALKHYWNLFRPLFRDDLEQNIEYWYGDENIYVRIPWQLYLIAISARLSPLRIFSSSVVQDKLSLIYHSFKGGGYRYPHSGKFVSSRTIAIVYDVNDKILAETSKEIFQKVWNIADRFRGIFSSAMFVWLARLSATLIGGFAVYRWAMPGEGDWGDLAPEIIGAVLIFFVSFGRRR